MPLTNRQIEAGRTKAKRDHKPVLLWDDELRGFGCRVAISGKVSWIVKKRLGAGGRGSQQVKHVFGDLEEKPLDRARDEALGLLSDIRKAVHLSVRKREERHEQQRAFKADKLGDAVDLFVKKNGTGNRYWNEVEQRLNVELVSALGKNRTVESITKYELRDLIDKKEANFPGGARLLFAAIRPFLKWCIERDILKTSPLDGIASPKLSPSRDRILTDDEVKAFWQATEGFDLFGPFYRVLLLTAQRRDEVAGMRWSEIDLHNRTWTIPKERTKNGKEHLVHLSDEAIAVLATVTKTKGVDLVFTTTGKTPLSGFSRAKARLDTRMLKAMKKVESDEDIRTAIELRPFRIHDLRRTAASGMARLGYQPHIIERVLNHISGATGGLVGVYQRYEYLDERRRALESWGSECKNRLRFE